MAVYKNIVVDIPKENVTRETQKNGKPALIKYVLSAPYDREKGYAVPKRTIIGHQCEDSLTKMHPTTSFAEIFPSIWEGVTKKAVKPVEKNIGLFSAVQAINSKIGIKDILRSIYNKERTDAILDYCMYSIIERSGVTNGFESRMKKELLFSKDARDDKYYSDLFEKHMDEESSLAFRKEWALQCKKDGVEGVWLCIDGSNDDCHSKGVELAEKGHAKTHTNSDIVSFSYAVSPSGLPVTYDVYRGGLVDKKAMMKMIDVLKECGISLLGVVLDRGYCDSTALKYLVKSKIKYVIMVKGHPEGYDKVVAEYGNKIKMNAEYLVPYTYLFGHQEKIQVFKNFNRTDYITLFYDFKNGMERVETLLGNMYLEMKDAEGKLSGSKPVSISPQFKSLFNIKENNLTINTAELQKRIDEKGLYGILSSDKMNPKDIHDLYASRNASETTFSQLKTQLGYGVARLHFDRGVCAKFEVGFISSIIRYEIEKAARTLNRSTNQMILELESIKMQKVNDIYTYTHVENERIISFFKTFDVSHKEIIDESVVFENKRLSGHVPAPRKRKTGPKKGTRKKKYDSDGNPIRNKTGVKTGTKRSDFNKDGTPRRKPGVPTGTKRGDFNKDGSPRKKTGPKPKTGIS